MTREESLRNLTIRGDNDNLYIGNQLGPAVATYGIMEELEQFVNLWGGEAGPENPKNGIRDKWEVYGPYACYLIRELLAFPPFQFSKKASWAEDVLDNCKLRYRGLFPC